MLSCNDVCYDEHGLLQVSSDYVQLEMYTSHFGKENRTGLKIIIVKTSNFLFFIMKNYLKYISSKKISELKNDFKFKNLYWHALF